MAAKQNGMGKDFPELIAEIGGVGQMQSATSPEAPLGQKVTAAMREALGWRPRTIDPKGFVAALNSSFEVTEVDGHTEWKWTPRSYAVQADMGAVTGAQASIYSRAKAALDHSKPLVEGIYSLNPATDEDEAEAIRSLVIAEMEELVNELGVVGGWRTPRIEGLFATLLGDSRAGNALKVSGLFGELRDQLGLQHDRVNTVAEEQNLTNFLIVADHFLSLHDSWVHLGKGGNSTFLGTELVQLSRSLAVIYESVQQVYHIMEAVLLGPADRQTTKLPLTYNGKQMKLTIAELLSWIEHFSQEEAKRIIDEAGLVGVRSFRTTVETLAKLTKSATELSSTPNTPGAQLPRNFFHGGVRMSLGELSKHLNEALNIVNTLQFDDKPISSKPISIDRLVSNRAIQGSQSQLIQVYGEQLDVGYHLRFGGNITSTVLQKDPGATGFTTEVTIENNSQVGTYTVQVYDQNMAWLATGPANFTVEQAASAGPFRQSSGSVLTPEITRLKPPSALVSGQVTRLKIIGANFQQGVRVSIWPIDRRSGTIILRPSDYRLINSGQIDITNLDLRKVKPGQFNVRVANQDQMVNLKLSPLLSDKGCTDGTHPFNSRHRRDTLCRQ